MHKSTITRSLAVATASLVLISSASAQVVLTQWTFEAPNTPADVTNAAVYPNPILPAIGAGIAGAVHASANTDWTTPAGNGSVDSLSSNEWTVGDYYQFQTSTVGFTDIGVAFDQTGSNTGPRDFKLAYSIDGSIFTDFGTPYTLINGSWSAGTPVLTTSYSFDLSAVPEIENAVTVFFRLIDNSTTAITGGTVATAGTGRVDNFTVLHSVPEPSALTALIGAVTLLGLVRRRRA